ncbi:MAG TPA: HAMP domain-containing sensor histidine kinase [Gemmatimonadaceae bacterium]|nr:HAMP domain-containing sensor histidine kinase [Gemmatimonadaceae bacterium]
MAPPGDPDERSVGDRQAASASAPLPPLARASIARGVSLYAALFAGVLVLLLVTLVLEDNALREAYSSETSQDAAASAQMVESAVSRRTSALQGLQGIVVDSVVVADSARFRQLLHPVATQPTPLLDRVIVAASDGRIVHDTTLAFDGAIARALPELERMLRPESTVVHRRPYVVALRSVPDVVAIVVPLTTDGRTAGAAVGAVRVSSMLRRAINVAPARRRLLLVRQGGETVLRAGDTATGDTRSASAPARVASGMVWHVDVVHEDEAPGLRTTLWALGGSALFFLVLGFVRERRQARHVAERSAELERLSAELLRSNRMKSEFLANISHELRTPLNAIVGFVELLKDGVYGELSPRQINPVDRIAGSANHLRHLVDQVLDIAKMAAGRLEVHLESIVLRPFVLNVASELESLAADKGIVLSLTVSASLPRVRTDPSHLRQILVNLVGNAIKYTPSGGAVAIRTRIVGLPAGVAWRAPTPPAGSPVPRPMTNPQGSRVVEDDAVAAALSARSPDPSRPWILIQVSDTGIGIAPEHQERIFEEFEQVDAGPRGESMHRGTGLGLPISRRLARLLGGDVTVESNVGRGATFTLWLPVDLARTGSA